MNVYKGNKIVDKLSINNDITSGNQYISFTYLMASSSTSNISVVRCVIAKGNVLTLDLREQGEAYSIESFFVSCEGTAACKPRMFYTASGMVWSCREFYECVSPEQADTDKCRITTSLL
ncbi:MAG TPA: hypothetical protein VF676_01445 [Flavobacterium sp.]